MVSVGPGAVNADAVESAVGVGLFSSGPGHLMQAECLPWMVLYL
jgi:hypothetical protein